MTDEEREVTERRLIEVNRGLGILAPAGDRRPNAA